MYKGQRYFYLIVSFVMLNVFKNDFLYEMKYVFYIEWFL